MDKGTIGKCFQTGLPIYTDHDGSQHRLGCLPSDPVEIDKLMAASDVIALIDSSLWTEGNAVRNATMTLSQRSHGSCVGFSAAGAEQVVRVNAGEAFVKLSGSYVYSWINGGRDGGASIIAAMSALQAHGTCTDAECDWNTIYRGSTKQFDISAANRKMGFGIRVNTYQEFCSCLQRGIPVQFAIQVGGNFSRYDSNGVCGYGGRGSNHSVFAYRMRKAKDGTLLPEMVNSWDNTWGPFGDGTSLITEQHFDGGGGGFAHAATYTNPTDPNIPPAPVV